MNRYLIFTSLAFSWKLLSLEAQDRFVGPCKSVSINNLAITETYFTYNSKNQLCKQTQRSTDPSTEIETTMEYDAQGRLTGKVERNNQKQKWISTFKYQPNFRDFIEATIEEFSNDGDRLEKTKVIKIVYDEASQSVLSKSLRSVANGKSLFQEDYDIEYTYGPDQRLKQVNAFLFDDNGNRSAMNSTDVEYEAEGEKYYEIHKSADSVVEYSYSASTRLKLSVDTMLLNREGKMESATRNFFFYDAAGNLLEIVDALHPTHKTTYHYDCWK